MEAAAARWAGGGFIFEGRVELATSPPRPRTGRLISGKFFAYWGHMQTIRPENTDPIPLRNSPAGMGTIIIRFVGLLVVIVVVLALAWSR
jgi:hypothetical protein